MTMLLSVAARLEMPGRQPSATWPRMENPLHKIRSLSLFDVSLGSWRIEVTDHRGLILFSLAVMLTVTASISH